MTLKPFVLLACVFQLTTLSASAFDFVPFRVRNLTPTVLVQSLATAEPARLTTPGGTEATVDFDLASHAILSRNSGEQLRLDGETRVTTLALRRGLNQRLQVGFELPWVSHDKGSLDGFIAGWHDFFGLPNGDRDVLPDNELAFGYLRNNAALLNLDRPENGLGDLRLQLAWQIAANELTASALHVSLKLPTGDAAKLTGSEGWGASLALALERRILLAPGTSAAIWGGLRGSWLGDGRVLAAQARNLAASAWLGTGWSPLEWLAFKLQLDAQTPLYDSDLTPLGSAAAILTMGGTLALGERTSIDLNVGEDIAVKTAPDVTFQLGLSHLF
jgi:Protein of unknown function (DUF3187)